MGKSSSWAKFNGFESSCNGLWKAVPGTVPRSESCSQVWTPAPRRARPIANAHSVREIVLHVAAWLPVVERRLKGEVIVNLPPEEDWPSVRGTSEQAWRRAIKRLARGHAELGDTIVRLPESGLGEIVAGKPYTAYEMLHGIIEHGIYHAGQIALLKKALP